MPRYRFADFVLSPRRRVLLRGGREVPLIPRYFDLLVFLVDHRDRAVHRRDIFDQIWSDVVVSDSALSQAVRTIRRVLGDDSRDPRFVRTVSRHGYQFSFPHVIEEDDAGERWPPGEETGDDPAPSGTNGAFGSGADLSDPPKPGVTVFGVRPEGQSEGDPYEPLLQRLTAPAANDLEDRWEAAERLHTLGTANALRKLGTRPRHAYARALLRETRWDTAEAGHVPILGQPAAMTVTRELVRLRLARAAGPVASRWAGASIGGGLAGALAGAVGGVLLAVAPGTTASLAVVPVLSVVGACCGAAGGAGVGAGLSVAESVARSWRSTALVCGAALGGGVVGLAAQWLSRWTLTTLVGLDVDTGGAVEGLALGAAAGLGYAAATPRAGGGLATARGGRRLGVAALVAGTCGVAALALTLAGRPLVGGTIHAVADGSLGSQTTLTPLARLVGEPDFGPVTAAIVGTSEGMVFGFGLALGMSRRPRRALR